MRLYKFCITDAERQELVDMFNAAKGFEPQDYLENYWELVDKYLDFFQEDTFDEDCKSLPGDDD